MPPLTTREILAQQAHEARVAAAAATDAPAPTMPATTTMHIPGDDDTTHVERLNEFDGKRPPQEVYDMLSPEQFAELKGLLEPIAEVNILMLPMIRAQVADFEKHQARLLERDEAPLVAEDPAEAGKIGEAEKDPVDTDPVASASQTEGGDPAPADPLPAPDSTI